MKRSKATKERPVVEEQPAGPRFVNAYYDKRDIVFVERCADDSIKLHAQRGLATCFFHERDMTDELYLRLKEAPEVHKVINEKPWIRVVWRGDRRSVEPHIVWLHDHGFPTYEATISPIRRYVADNRVQVVRPRCVFVDIETDSDVPIIEAIKGKARIFCWTLVDTDGKKQAGCLASDTDAAEKKLLEKLWRCLEPYDQIAAWNGARFDFPVIKLRTKKRKLKVNDRRWLWLDQLALFKRFNMSASGSGDEKQSFKLDAIATALLGVGKNPFDAARTRAAFDNAVSCESGSCASCRRCLVKYCLQDTDLLRQIEDATGYVELLYKVCEVTGAFPDSYGLNPGNFVENYLLRVGAEVNHHFPTRIYDEDAEPEEKYEGAYVMKPPKVNGIERNIHVADFASLYPSIVQTWNMSPETLTKASHPLADENTKGICRTATHAVFRTDVKGVLPLALERILKLRSKWKKLAGSLPPGTKEWKEADRRSKGYKIVANSFYGVIGSPMGRMHNRDVAECITQCGVFLLKLTMKAAEEKGMKVVYGDTDSIFVKGHTEEEFGEFVKWCNETLYPSTLKELGCTENHINLGYEKMFDRLVMTTAKKYCNTPDAPVFMADLSEKKLGDICEGDEVVGWVKGSNTSRAKLVASTVVKVHRRFAPVVEVEFESGKKIKCTSDHRWYNGPGRFRTPKVGRTVKRVLEDLPECPPELSRDAAWLGGIWDGEGSLCGGSRGQITLAQSFVKNPEVCARIENTLAKLGIEYSLHGPRKARDGMNVYALRGGRTNKLKFLRWCQPAKWRRLIPAVLKTKFGIDDRIVAIRPVGSGKVIGLTTTTGNYIAWGYASKNCGSFIHYDGTRATADSEPEIKGLEFKRGDSAKFAREMQEEVVHRIVGYKKDAITDPADMIEVVKKWRKRILIDPLELSDVTITKKLSKNISEYKQREKKDGTLSLRLPHVEIAAQLIENGEDIGPGDRISYILIDGGSTPKKYVSLDEAYDASGKLRVDRYALWDDLVYPHTQRVLEAAYPTYDWAQYARSRPKKPRKKKGKPVPPEQGLLFDGSEKPVKSSVKKKRAKKRAKKRRKRSEAVRAS